MITLLIISNLSTASIVWVIVYKHMKRPRNVIVNISKLFDKIDFKPQ